MISIDVNEKCPTAIMDLISGIAGRFETLDGLAIALEDAIDKTNFGIHSGDNHIAVFTKPVDVNPMKSRIAVLTDGIEI